MVPIFPKTVDNTYRGQWLALPFLALAALSKIAMSFNAIFLTRMVMEKADHIPLERYGAAAVPMVTYLFQAWAIGHGLLALLAVLAMIRYRAMIPLVTLLLLIEQLGRKALRLASPLPGVPHDWTSIGYLVTQGLLAALVIALVLSLWPRRAAQA